MCCLLIQALAAACRHLLIRMCHRCHAHSGGDPVARPSFGRPQVRPCRAPNRPIVCQSHSPFHFQIPCSFPSNPRLSWPPFDFADHLLRKTELSLCLVWTSPVVAAVELVAHLYPPKVTASPSHLKWRHHQLHCPRWTLVAVALDLEICHCPLVAAVLPVIFVFPNLCWPPVAVDSIYLVAALQRNCHSVQSRGSIHFRFRNCHQC